MVGSFPQLQASEVDAALWLSNDIVQIIVHGADDDHSLPSTLPAITLDDNGGEVCHDWFGNNISFDNM